MSDQTPIEKIRAEVSAILGDHSETPGNEFGDQTWCPVCDCDWPCHAAELASDKLKLAEALEKMGQLDPYPCECDDHTSEICCVAVEWFCGQCWSARFLAEVSR